MAALQQVICVIENILNILKKKLCKENAENLP